MIMKRVLYFILIIPLFVLQLSVFAQDDGSGDDWDAWGSDSDDDAWGDFDASGLDGDLGGNSGGVNVGGEPDMDFSPDDLDMDVSGDGWDVGSDGWGDGNSWGSSGGTGRDANFGAFLNSILKSLGFYGKSGVFKTITENESDVYLYLNYGDTDEYRSIYIYEAMPDDIRFSHTALQPYIDGDVPSGSGNQATTSSSTSGNTGWGDEWSGTSSGDDGWGSSGSGDDGWGSTDAGGDGWGDDFGADLDASLGGASAGTSAGSGSGDDDFLKTYGVEDLSSFFAGSDTLSTNVTTVDQQVNLTSTQALLPGQEEDPVEIDTPTEEEIVQIIAETPISMREYTMDELIRLLQRSNNKVSASQADVALEISRRFQQTIDLRPIPVLVDLLKRIIRDPEAYNFKRNAAICLGQVGAYNPIQIGENDPQWISVARFLKC